MATEKTIQQINELMTAFWTTQTQEMETGELDFKYHQLPLARIKKVMKSDEDVKNMVPCLI
jgi:nuclear transcription factor Y gamma